MTGPWPDDGVYTDPLEAADEAAFTAAMLDEADAPGTLGHQEYDEEEDANG
jgi:hypothetical protein